MKKFFYILFFSFSLIQPRLFSSDRNTTDDSLCGDNEWFSEESDAPDSDVTVEKERQEDEDSVLNFISSYRAKRRALDFDSDDDEYDAKKRLLEKIIESDFVLDDCTYNVFGQALDEIAKMKDEYLDTPQKRIPTIFNIIYQTLTGLNTSIFDSPVTFTLEKLAKIMKIHRDVFAHIQKEEADSKVLRLLSNCRFQNYLRNQNCEVVLVDIGHIFDGDQDGGGHVYCSRNDQQRFIDEVTNASKKVLQNKNEVIYAVDRKGAKERSASIFPMHLEAEEIFGMIRGAQVFLCRQNNRVLVRDSNSGLIIEMYMQQQDRVVRSAFPIFSYIDLKNCNLQDSINIFDALDLKSGEAVKKDVEYKELIDVLNKILIASLQKPDDNCPFRYFKDNNLVIDVAPYFEEETGIKNGLYVEVSADLFDHDLVTQIGDVFCKPDTASNLRSPFNNNYFDFDSAKDE